MVNLRCLECIRITIVHGKSKMSTMHKNYNSSYFGKSKLSRMHKNYMVNLCTRIRKLVNLDCMKIKSKMHY